MAMNKKLKEKWIAALESGKYKQAKGRLCKPKMKEKGYNYCCLGVLERIKGKSPKQIINIDKDTMHLGSNDEVCKYGLKRENRFKLAGMNDNGTTFKRIAKYLKENTHI